MIITLPPGYELRDDIGNVVRWLNENVGECESDWRWEWEKDEVFASKLYINNDRTETALMFRLKFGI